MIDSNATPWNETSHSAQIDAAIDALRTSFWRFRIRTTKEAMQIIAKQIGQAPRLVSVAFAKYVALPCRA